MCRRIQTILKKLHQEPLIERFEETVFSLFILTPPKFITQVIHITIKETFLLDKIAEHQPVKHYRSIPLFISIILQFNSIVYTGNKLSKRIMFLFKTGIEILGNLLGIHSKCTLNSFLYIYNCRMLTVSKSQSANL